MPTPARRLSPGGTPQWKSVQPLSRRLVPEPEPCVEVSPTISSQTLSTSYTNSGSFPTREVTFHVPRASFCSPIVCSSNGGDKLLCFSWFYFLSVLLIEKQSSYNFLQFLVMQSTHNACIVLHSLN
ncbi:hypothetical protein ILYODFUR_012789 [Ilyodon furcidens]|uniref:Uncharacterized protein n=1 Tax=Ilyodon furcidens TaxID=33524 RepID=A0ABV0SWH9_9TELE